jgi:uncharacterized membrane protein
MTALCSAKQLKGIAKERSLERYGTLIGANVIIFLIQFVAFTFATLFTSNNLIGIIITQLSTLIIDILLGVLVSGKAFLYLNLLYSQTISISDIFFGLKQCPDKAVKIQSLFVISSFVSSLPYTITTYYLRSIGQLPGGTGNPTTTGLIDLSTAGFIALFAAILFRIAITLYVYLTYSQAFFILHDFPGRSADDILRTSRNLMKGNRLKLFCLNLSFVPVYLLGIIALFIPLLWISVYRDATVTAFYQDLIAKAGSSKNNKEGESWT